MTLTQRERQVMQMVCDDMTHKEIASELGIGIKTVHWFVGKIKTKLGIAGCGIAILVKVAIKNGWTTV